MAAAQRTVDELEHTLEIAPTNSHALAYLSTCYLAAGRFEDAERAYVKALSMDPWQKNPGHYLAIKKGAALDSSTVPDLAVRLAELDALAEAAANDPLASSHQMQDIAGTKGAAMGKDPAAWLDSQEERIQGYVADDRSSEAVEAAEVVRRSVLDSPFASAEHVTRVALLRASALRACGRVPEAILAYEQILSGSRDIRSAWPENASRTQVEAQLIDAYRKAGRASEADALQARIAARDARQPQAAPARPEPSDIAMAVVGLAVLTAAFQPTCIVALVAVLAAVYGSILLFSRGRKNVRKTPWRAKAVARAYVVCMLCTGVALAIVLVLVFKLESSVFGDEIGMAALGVAVVCAFVAAAWGAWRFPRFTAAADWDPAATRCERLRAAWGLLLRLSVVCFVFGYVPWLFLVYQLLGLIAAFASMR